MTKTYKNHFSTSHTVYVLCCNSGDFLIRGTGFHKWHDDISAKIEVIYSDEGPIRVIFPSGKSVDCLACLVETWNDEVIYSDGYQWNYPNIEGGNKMMEKLKSYIALKNS